MAVVVYVLGAVLSWPVIAGMMFRENQGMWLQLGGQRSATNHWRRDLGSSAVFGAAFSTLWPLALPMVFCMTGFAEHGVFTQRRVDK